MHGTLKLDPENLAVESFATDAVPPVPGTADAEGLPTCMQTDCGRYRCCA
ncbi:MAG TPA: hypothetical protein VEX86_06300 [Longimicrobium sp.]|nr:hypothetical protein [Longimicrobium sp.]